MKDDIIVTHLIPIILKFCGKELACLYRRHKDMVAFPEVKLKHRLVRNPRQSAFRGIDQLTSEIVCGKDENRPVIAFEPGEHQQPAQPVLLVFLYVIGFLLQWNRLNTIFVRGCDFVIRSR